MQFGYLIGIIYELYFKKSIAFVLLIIGIIYLILRKIKYKNARYIKLLLNSQVIILLFLSALFSNTYIHYLNYRYNTFYENAPQTIKAKAVVIRGSTRKRVLL